MENLTHQSQCDMCQNGNGQGDKESLRLRLHRENTFGVNIFQKVKTLMSVRLCGLIIVNRCMLTSTCMLNLTNSYHRDKASVGQNVVVDLHYIQNQNLHIYVESMKNIPK